jgi:hypothetical protein
MTEVSNFINWLVSSSFFGINSWQDLGSIITSVGLAIALIGFWYRRYDEKRAKAALISDEIVNMERTANRCKESGQIKFYDVLLPTQTWLNYRTIFIKDLKPEELEVINKCYSIALTFDNAIAELRELKYSSIFQAVIKELDKETTGGLPINMESINTKIFLNSNQATSTIANMTAEFLREFPQIMNTSGHEKIRQISNKKILWVF